MSEFNKWIKITRTYIDNKEWDKIYICTNDSKYWEYYRNKWIIRELLPKSPFIKDMEDVIIRLSGEIITTEGWYTQLIDSEPSISAIHYFINNKKLEDINKCWDNKTLIERILLDFHFPFEKKIELTDILIKLGANINIQDDFRNSILFKCIDMTLPNWSGLYNDYSIINNERIITVNIVKYLIEIGADLLLENRDGISPINHLYNEPYKDEIVYDLISYIQLYILN